MASGIEDSSGRHDENVLPVENFAFLRRIREGGGVPADDFLLQQHPHHLGRVPALGPGGRERCRRRPCADTAAAYGCRSWPARRGEGAAPNCCSCAHPAPSGGAGLERSGFVDHHHRSGLCGGGQVVEDRGEIPVAEPARRGHGQCLIDRSGAWERGRIRLPWPSCGGFWDSSGGGVGQPAVCALTEGEEVRAGFGQAQYRSVASGDAGSVRRRFLGSPGRTVGGGRSPRHRFRCGRRSPIPQVVARHRDGSVLCGLSGLPRPDCSQSHCWRRR